MPGMPEKECWYIGCWENNFLLRIGSASVIIICTAQAPEFASVYQYLVPDTPINQGESRGQQQWEVHET